MPPTGDYLLHSARLRDARRRPDLTAAGGRNNRRRGWSDLPLRTPGVTRSRSSGGHRRHGWERRGRRPRAARRGQLEGRALVLIEVAADAGGIGEEGRDSGSRRRCGGSGGSPRARGCSRRGGRSGRGAVGRSCRDARGGGERELGGDGAAVEVLERHRRHRLLLRHDCGRGRASRRRRWTAAASLSEGRCA